MSRRNVVRGFFGKIPGCGDFVRFALPASFVAAWDAWAASTITAAQACMGAGFREIWLQAPAWRFALAAGVCGPDAATGVWLPGRDSVGRLFPLVLVALSNDPVAVSETKCSWLTLAEQAGRDTLVSGDGPESLRARVLGPPLIEPIPVPSIDAGSVWWTEGGPHVAPRTFALDTLPPPGHFAGMLNDAFAVNHMEPSA